jgi:predicted RNA binding protein YcfA (HicA-like mRNA interferase family)
MSAIAKKTLQKILGGSTDIRFAEMVSLVEAFGFRLDRVRSSHHIFVHPDVDRLVNLQEVKEKPNLIKFGSFSRLWKSII